MRPTEISEFFNLSLLIYFQKRVWRLDELCGHWQNCGPPRAFRFCLRPKGGTRREDWRSIFSAASTNYGLCSLYSPVLSGKERRESRPQGGSQWESCERNQSKGPVSNCPPRPQWHQHRSRLFSLANANATLVASGADTTKFKVIATALLIASGTNTIDL